MSRRLWGILILCACVAGLVPAPPTNAEDERPVVRAEVLPSDLELVARSGGSFVALRPADLLSNEVIKNLPPTMKEGLTATVTFMAGFFGVDATNVERLSIPIVSYEHEPAFVIRTIKPYDRDRLTKAVGGEANKDNPRGLKLHFVDQSTFVIGRPKSIETLLAKANAKDTPRPHTRAVAWAAEGHHLVLGGKPADTFLLMWGGHRAESRAAQGAVDKEAPTKNKEPEPKKDEKPRPPEPREKEEPISFRLQDRPLVLEAKPDPLAALLAEMPPEALPYKPLLLAKSGAIAIDLGNESRAQWQFTFADEDAARDGEMSVRVLLYLAREMLPLTAREMQTSRQTSPKLFAFLDSVQASLKAAKVELRGTEVTGGVAIKTDGVVLTAFGEEVEKAALRAKARNHLIQIGVAMHNYHGAFNGLPADAIRDKDGKPLLLRVAILPYLEQENLYRQFKLDEPWDSAHNIKLVEKIPPIYAPLTGNTKKGETHLRVFTGANTPFDLRGRRPGPAPIGPRLSEFFDGTSNTLLVVESSESVPWTKPEELAYDPKKPLPKLGDQVPDGFFALFGDGVVRLLSFKLVDEETMRRLIDPRDGQVIDWDKIEPGRGRGRFGTAEPPRPEPPTETRPTKPATPVKPPEREKR